MNSRQLNPSSPPRTSLQTKRARRRRNGNKQKKLNEIVDSVLDSLSEGDSVHRKGAIEHIEKLLSRWVFAMYEKTEVNPWQRPRSALVTFGSYRLESFHADSDLDCLALCPPMCSREDFFSSFVALLRNDPSISQVHPIPTAYTPVIKFMIHDLHVDLLFARLKNATRLLQFQQSKVSPLVSPANGLPSLTQRREFIIEDQDLIGQDEQGIRSLNGVRLSQVLLEMVPQLSVYRKVLKVVKEWAKRHGVYSNAIGFLGGVNWAIMVAYVCLHHPGGSPALLFKKFFETFSRWKWPAPVLLQPIQMQPPESIAATPCAQMQGWNPAINPRDALHVMPIITPTWPQMNSSYNVGLPQARRIKEEMIRTLRLLEEASTFDIFRPPSFFKEHKYYMQLTISAPDKTSFVEWFRLVESRVRFLITNLETEHVQAYPFSHFFNRKYKDGFPAGRGVSQPNEKHESCFFIGLRFREPIHAQQGAPTTDTGSTSTIPLHYLTSDFLHKVNSWEGRKNGMTVALSLETQNSLPPFVWDEWDDFICGGSSDSSSTPLSPENSLNNLLSPTKKFRYLTTSS